MYYTLNLPHFAGHDCTFHAATFIDCKQLKTLLLTVLEQINSDLLQHLLIFLAQCLNSMRCSIYHYLYTGRIQMDCASDMFARICKMESHSYISQEIQHRLCWIPRTWRVSKLRGDLRATKLKLTLSWCIIGPLSRAAACLCFWENAGFGSDTALFVSFLTSQPLKKQLDLTTRRSGLTDAQAAGETAVIVYQHQSK